MYTPERELNPPSEFWQSEPKTFKCPLCLDYFDSEDQLIEAGIETKYMTKKTVCCVECLNNAFIYEREAFYPTTFQMECRELKASGKLTYENLINNLK